MAREVGLRTASLGLQQGLFLTDKVKTALYSGRGQLSRGQTTTRH